MHSIRSTNRHLTGKAMGVAIALTVIGAPPVFGLPILGLWNTGVDDSGTPNAIGVVESHYQISTGFGLDSEYTFTTVNPATPYWVASPSDARWIGPSMSAGDAAMLSDPVGTYYYDLVFSLDPFSSAEISGLWASDNFGRILLNGAEIAALGLGDFGSLNPFTISDSNLFLEGFNLLQFEVTNAEGKIPTGNPSGLLVAGLTGSYEAAITSISASLPTDTGSVQNVPDGGSTILMLISGLAALVVSKSRRRVVQA